MPGKNITSPIIKRAQPRSPAQPDYTLIQVQNLLGSINTSVDTTELIKSLIRQRFINLNGAGQMDFDALRHWLHVIINHLKTDPNLDLSELVKTILEVAEEQCTPDQLTAVINKPDAQGNTLLHIAIAFAKKYKNDIDRAEIVELLLKKGADPWVQNKDGSTPNTFAESYKILSRLLEFYSTNNEKFVQAQYQRNNFLNENCKEFWCILEEIDNLLKDILLRDYLQQTQNEGYTDKILEKVSTYKKQIFCEAFNEEILQKKENFENTRNCLLISSVRSLVLLLKNNNWTLSKNILTSINYHADNLRTFEKKHKTQSRMYLTINRDSFLEKIGPTIIQLFSLLADPKLQTSLSQPDNNGSKTIETNIKEAINNFLNMNNSQEIRNENKNYLENILNWINNNYTQLIDETTNANNNTGPNTDNSAGANNSTDLHIHIDKNFRSVVRLEKSLSTPITLFSSKIQQQPLSNSKAGNPTPDDEKDSSLLSATESLENKRQNFN